MREGLEMKISCAEAIQGDAVKLGQGCEPIIATRVEVQRSISVKSSRKFRRIAGVKAGCMTCYSVVICLCLLPILLRSSCKVGNDDRLPRIRKSCKLAQCRASFQFVTVAQYSLLPDS
jgi:hypothetical protein